MQTAAVCGWIQFQRCGLVELQRKILPKWSCRREIAMNWILLKANSLIWSNLPPDLSSRSDWLDVSCMVSGRSKLVVAASMVAEPWPGWARKRLFSFGISNGRSPKSTDVALPDVHCFCGKEIHFNASCQIVESMGVELKREQVLPVPWVYFGFVILAYQMVNLQILHAN